MRGGGTTWSFETGDLQRLDRLLEAFLRDTRARYAVVVDRSGQLLTAAGHAPGLDGTAFASLAAADFAASNQLAQLLGEDEFAALYHHGDDEGMYLVDVGGRAILAVLCGERSTLGLLRLRSRMIVPHLAALFEEIAGRQGAGRIILEPGWLAEAESEIDRLFGE